MVEKAPISNDQKGRLLICLCFTCYSLLSRSSVLLLKLDFVQGSWPSSSIKRTRGEKGKAEARITRVQRADHDAIWI